MRRSDTEVVSVDDVPRDPGKDFARHAGIRLMPKHFSGICSVNSERCRRDSMAFHYSSGCFPLALLSAGILAAISLGHESPA